MNNTILELIKNSVLLSDGAMGTMLQQNGLPSGHCPEEWNVSHSDIISKIHRAYYNAGADLVETNTFGGNRYRLDFQGFSDMVYEFNYQGARIARETCPKQKFVAGSVGPTGEFLEPVGNRTFEEMTDVFKEQIEALLSGGIDLVIVETMSDLQEARAAISAAKSLKKDLPVISTMTFEKTTNGFHTMMGVTVKQMITELPAAGADLIGANCGLGMEEMHDVVAEIRAETKFPLLSQANAGTPVWDGSKNVYSETPAQRAAAVKKLLTLQPQIIGGCCGTTPEHIAAIREIIDNYMRGN